MEIKISHSEAIKQHPSIVKKWMKDAKNSGITFDPKEVKWSYAFCIKVSGMSGSDFVNKLGSDELFEQNNSAKMTPEEIADAVIKNVVGLSINVIGTGFSREEPLKNLSKLFIGKYKSIIIDSEKRMQEEYKRFDGLTPIERKREEQEIINELFETKEFFAFEVSNEGVKPLRPEPVLYDMDEILDKVSKVGLKGLTEGEIKFMEAHSNSMNQK